MYFVRIEHKVNEVVTETFHMLDNSLPKKLKFSSLVSVCVIESSDLKQAKLDYFNKPSEAVCGLSHTYSFLDPKRKFSTSARLIRQLPGEKYIVGYGEIYNNPKVFKKEVLLLLSCFEDQKKNKDKIGQLKMMKFTINITDSHDHFRQPDAILQNFQQPNGIVRNGIAYNTNAR